MADSLVAAGPRPLPAWWVQSGAVRNLPYKAVGTVKGLPWSVPGFLRPLRGVPPLPRSLNRVINSRRLPTTCSSLYESIICIYIGRIRSEDDRIRSEDDNFYPYLAGKV